MFDLSKIKFGHCIEANSVIAEVQVDDGTGEAICNWLKATFKNVHVETSFDYEEQGEEDEDGPGLLTHFTTSSLEEEIGCELIYYFDDCKAVGCLEIIVEAEKDFDYEEHGSQNPDGKWSSEWGFFSYNPIDLDREWVKFVQPLKALVAFFSTPAVAQH